MKSGRYNNSGKLFLNNCVDDKMERHTWKASSFKICITSAFLPILLIVTACQRTAPENKRQNFYPGEPWYDTEGNRIEAHAGGILKVDSIYYWYGENHTLGTGNRTGISCYSSRDLYNWKNEGVVLPKDSVPAAYRDSGVCERPKVIFNKKTNRYVMWMHLDGQNYTLASAGIAVSERPTGPFRFLKEFRPIAYDYGFRQGQAYNSQLKEKEKGNAFRDMNLFVDDDDTAYVFYASEDNATMYCVQLNDEYTDIRRPAIKGVTWERILPEMRREAPAPFKFKGKYYLITSGLTGWAPNPALYHTADRILGPWKTHNNPCIGPESDVTFRSQGTFVLKAPSGPENAFIFMADRWVGNDLSRSTMVWLPLLIRNDGTFSLEFTDKWNLSVFETPCADLPAPVARIKHQNNHPDSPIMLEWKYKGIQPYAFRILENGKMIGSTSGNNYCPPQHLAGQAFCYTVVASYLTAYSPPSRPVMTIHETTDTVWLSDIEPERWNQGYGKLQKNISIEGFPIQIAGKKFCKGLGTHAYSEITYYTGCRYERFEAFVGIDDYPSFTNVSSAEFIVMGDGKILWRSGTMHVRDVAKQVSVSLSGVSELKLIVTDGGDGNHYDHVNWAEARLIP